jgi:hypothetical protein
LTTSKAIQFQAPSGSSRVPPWWKPTIATLPLIRVASASEDSPLCVPVTSKLTSAPAPPVASQTASASDSPRTSTVRVAPSRAASASASGRVSATITSRGPLSWTSCCTRLPMKPAPTITTSSPSAGAASSTALTAQPSGSASATSSGTDPAGKQCSARATTYSAKPRAGTQAATRSPGRRWSAPAPARSTVPLTSWPGKRG